MTLELTVTNPQDLTTEEKDAIKAEAIAQLRELFEDEIEAILFSKPACVQCGATYRKFDSDGVLHLVIDLSENPELLELVKRAGYMTAPVVVTRDDHWMGFRPDKIDEIVSLREAA